jgi:phosphatidate phosphatase APP1
MKSNTESRRNGPFVKVYDGYGDADDVLVQGHVLLHAPRPVPSGSPLANARNLLRLFKLRPLPHVPVELHWMGERLETTCDADGYFLFEWKPRHAPGPGWHPVHVQVRGTEATGTARVFSPYTNQFSVISDIDDTFLVSHSSRTFKRLRLLLTRDAHTRQPFDDVVEHYRALAEGTGDLAAPNPFFYVSSSEWNLYDYLRTFCRTHGLPEGIFLLSPLKRLATVWRSGQGRHSLKYDRILRVIRSFPHHRYVLLGDDSQQDPEIYADVVRKHPHHVQAVYLRRVRPSRSMATSAALERMRGYGVHCCHFATSREAIAHSQGIGLIGPAVGRG